MLLLPRPSQGASVRETARERTSEGMSIWSDRCEKTWLQTESRGLFLVSLSPHINYRGTLRGRELAGKRKQVKTIAGRVSVT